MAILLKHKILIFFIIMLGFIAVAAWHSSDELVAYWAMWTVPIIFLGIWLIFDCIFVDDKAFVFDHDYEWRDRRILVRGRKPDWNISTSLDANRLETVRVRTNFDRDPGKSYQYNFRAEVLPPKSPDPVPRPHRFKVSGLAEEEVERRRAQRMAYPENTLEHPKRVAEMPVNPRLGSKPTWNKSTQDYVDDPRTSRREISARHVRPPTTTASHVKRKGRSFIEKLDPRECGRVLDNFEAECKVASRRHSSRLRAYTAPEQRESQRRQRIRGLKRNGLLWKLYRAELAPLPLTQNRLAKDCIQRIRKFRHSGKWEFRESEGCFMWSDTASYVLDSPGDIVREHNPAGFNFAAPCLVRRSALARQ